VSSFSSCIFYYLQYPRGATNMALLHYRISLITWIDVYFLLNIYRSTWNYRQTFSKTLTHLCMHVTAWSVHLYKPPSIPLHSSFIISQLPCVSKNVPGVVHGCLPVPPNLKKRQMMACASWPHPLLKNGSCLGPCAPMRVDHQKYRNMMECFVLSTGTLHTGLRDDAQYI